MRIHWDQRGRSHPQRPWDTADMKTLVAVCSLLRRNGYPGQEWQNRVEQRAANGEHHNARRDTWALLLLAAGKWTRFMVEEYLHGDPDLDQLLSTTLNDKQLARTLFTTLVYAVTEQNKQGAEPC